MKKQVKRMFTTVALMLCTIFVAQAGTDKTITFNQLPAAAQKTIQQHFKNKKTALVKQDTEWLSKSYDVIFTDGSKAEFDKNGVWTEVDCKPNTVPSFFVPKGIQVFIKSNYPGVTITKIEKVRAGYDVELSNHLEITFDKKCNVMDIDN